MNEDLSQAVLRFYRRISGNDKINYSDIRNSFKAIRVTEPLIHTSQVSGKIPVNDHLLDDDLIEDKFAIK